LRGEGRRRGFGRVVFLFALALSLAALTASCGKSGQGAKTDPEKGRDAESLNAALSHELALLRAYGHGTPLLSGELRATGRQFRAHQQEYVDAITKAIRGLGGETEVEPTEADVDLAGVESQAEFLGFAYRLENAAYAAYVDASPHLHTEAPRKLAASLAAAHAQHLVVLRQALGESPLQAVTEAFESGEAPPPEAASSSREGAARGAAN